MEDPRKALKEKLKTLSPEMLEAVGWLVEHWTVLKAIAEMERAAREGDCRLRVLIALHRVWQESQKTPPPAS